MQKKFIKKLEEMVGKTYQYANQIHYIISYKLDDDQEKCTLKTNVSEYVKHYESMTEFLYYWSEAGSVKALVPPSPDTEMQLFISQQNSKADKLIEILEDNIMKVQKDAAYIQQAASINNNINSIINIEKMKFDYAKSVKGRK